MHIKLNYKLFSRVAELVLSCNPGSEKVENFGRKWERARARARKRARERVSLSFLSRSLALILSLSFSFSRPLFRSISLSFFLSLSLKSESERGRFFSFSGHGYSFSPAHFWRHTCIILNTLYKHCVSVYYQDCSVSQSCPTTPCDYIHDQQSCCLLPFLDLSNIAHVKTGKQIYTPSR